MGSSVSRSGAMSAAADSEHALTAKVVGLDGSMAQLAAPVTAREALAAAVRGASPPHCYFLCCSDELDFDAPARALAARDGLQAGQLYFALPASMLRRPLSGQDIAALAVRASAALGAAPVVVEAAAAAAASRDKSGGAGASASASGAAGGRRQRRRAGRVAPVVVVSAQADGEWQHAHGARKAVSGDRTVGKARNGVGHKGGVSVTPHLEAAAVQRLSVIVESTY